ncbi:MAG: hypothetical protein K9M84_08260 [Spirochaetia bacterium]|nr:hypothetical protein [Spirochaetia bacterium]
MSSTFDITLRDSQYTQAAAIAPELFDRQEYRAYEQELLVRSREFLEAESGLLVYRRMRGDGVYYHKSKEHQESLALQLGVLKKSLSYKADVPNFLEPWYGIGYIASAFGGEYLWKEGQAPAVEPMFSSARQLLASEVVPLHQSPIGRIILERIEYFLDKTRGELPLSYCDIQSPANMLSYLLPMSDLCIDIFDDPDGVKQAVELVNELLIEFLKIQRDLIGDALVQPGHGFASSRVFSGAGESTDNVIMFSDDHYREFFQRSHEHLGDEFGGVVFHSCGSWSHKAPMVKSFRNTIMVDGAFSPETDPDPNDPKAFEQIFRDSGIIVNARCVGDSESVYPYFSDLINDHMKVIAVTYCQDPEDQEQLYDRLHALLK